jgi:hypothetical protein
MSDYVLTETYSTEGLIRFAKDWPIRNNHRDTLEESGWTALAILEKAAGEPCHRAEYGWQGDCANIQESGPDMHYSCARCLARAFFKDLAEKAQQQEAVAAA